MDNDKIHPGCLGPDCNAYGFCKIDPAAYKLGCIHFIEGDFENET